MASSCWARLTLLYFGLHDCYAACMFGPMLLPEFSCAFIRARSPARSEAALEQLPHAHTNSRALCVKFHVGIWIWILCALDLAIWCLDISRHVSAGWDMEVSLFL